MIMMAKWYSGTLGPKACDIYLTGEENPEKTSPRKIVPTGDRTRARWVTGAHATTWSTAVDMKCFLYDDGQWYPEIDEAWVFLTFVLWLRINPGKNLNQKNWPDRESNPGPLAERKLCYLSTTAMVLDGCSSNSRFWFYDALNISGH